jgi:hypothetical protein
MAGIAITPMAELSSETLGFIASDVSWVFMGLATLSKAPKCGAILIWIGILDGFFHLSGEAHSITQHSLVPLILGMFYYQGTSYALCNLFFIVVLFVTKCSCLRFVCCILSSGCAVLKANTFFGVLFFAILAVGFGLGFMDGAPGMTPGYDVFSSPSPKDPNYFIGHVGAHGALSVLPLMFLFIAPASKKDTKNA